MSESRDGFCFDCAHGKQTDLFTTVTPRHDWDLRDGIYVSRKKVLPSGVK